MQRIKRDAQSRGVQTPGFVSILIVDDERFDRARLRRICESLDFESLITEADTLESMDSALQTDTFDLIFLDFNMPDGDGLLALDAIQMNKNNRFAAVVMVTGDDDVDVAIAAMTKGCSDFIKKESVSVDSLRRAAVNVLQKAALSRGMEDETNRRGQMEAVPDQFTRQCVEEFQPMLYNVMRQVRGLQTVRQDEQKYGLVVNKIEKCCERMFDFVSDIEDAERKKAILMQVEVPDADVSIPEMARMQKSGKASLFGRRT